MKVIQKARTTPKKYTESKNKKVNASEECKASCKKCPPMTC